jgi:aryl-alcohol dehydrogenase-like predicted oxidoreductase
MRRRKFGNTGIELSNLTFGIMGLEPGKVTRKDAEALLCYLVDTGVTCFHSSHEYTSYAFFGELVRDYRGSRPSLHLQHIVKIGVPHFSEDRFRAAKLVAAVDNYLRDLKADRIDMVQWLLRSTPLEDARRIALLQEASAELRECVSTLQSCGKIGSFTSFPYSMEFARRWMAHEVSNGLVTYLNLAEPEMAELLPQLSSRGQGFVAIRPLAAGLLTAAGLNRSYPEPEMESRRAMLLRAKARLGVEAGALMRFSCQFPLLSPVVASVIVGVSSIDHAKQVVESVSDATPDGARFDRIVTLLDEARRETQPEPAHRLPS